MIKCTNPYVKNANPAGPKVHVMKNRDQALASTPFGCGQCIPCRIKQAYIWAFRNQAEAQEWKYSTYFTGTYEDEELPMNDDGTPIIYLPDWQLFMKRLRHNAKHEYGITKLKFFQVGEYGNLFGRPHHHAAIYGLDPVLHERLIDKAWTCGFTVLGSIEKASAMYIVKYCNKKMTNPNDDRLGNRPPEIMTCSNGPIGWSYLKNHADAMLRNKYIPNIPIHSIHFQGHFYPIGTTLSKTWADYCKIPQELRDEALNEYQNEIYDKFCIEGKEFDFYPKLMQEMETQTKPIIQKFKRNQKKGLKNETF